MYKIDIINSNGLVINKKDITDEQLNTFKIDLTAFNENNEEVSRFYFEDIENLYVPKLSFNLLSNLGYFIRNNCNIIEDNTIDYHLSNKELFKSIKMEIKPRNELQKNSVDFLIKSPSLDKSMFLSPGSGKTAMSIMYFVKKKIKPLILTPDSTLMKQWKDSILEFTNIKEEQIYLFEYGANSMNSKRFRETKDTNLVYIACVKTFSSLVKNNNFNELRELKSITDDMKIDIKIIDECHLNLSAIYRTTTWFPTKENLYLSATMNRRNIYEDNIHPSIVEPNEIVESSEYDIKPEMIALLYDSKPEVGNVRYCQDLCLRGGIDFHRYFKSYLLSSKNRHKLETYMNIIFNICDKYLIERSSEKYSHRIIIVNPSVTFLDYLYSRLNEKYICKRMYSKFKEKPNDNNYHIILGTPNMLTAGFDVKTLDVMINMNIFTSKANILQLLGRISRSAPGKTKAAYFCLADNGFSMMTRYLSKHINIASAGLSGEENNEFKVIKSKFEFSKYPPES